MNMSVYICIIYLISLNTEGKKKTVLRNYFKFHVLGDSSCFSPTRKTNSGQELCKTCKYW